MTVGLRGGDMVIIAILSRVWLERTRTVAVTTLARGRGSRLTW
jgi:hypothetical protein